MSTRVKFIDGHIRHNNTSQSDTQTLEWHKPLSHSLPLVWVGYQCLQLLLPCMQSLASSSTPPDAVVCFHLPFHSWLSLSGVIWRNGSPQLSSSHPESPQPEALGFAAVCFSLWTEVHLLHNTEHSHVYSNVQAKETQSNNFTPSVKEYKAFLDTKYTDKWGSLTHISDVYLISVTRLTTIHIATWLQIIASSWLKRESIMYTPGGWLSACRNQGTIWYVGPHCQLLFLCHYHIRRSPHAESEGCPITVLSHCPST